ncbi:hypothetical protein ACFX1T_009259 [Malus domestica]
MALSLFGNGRRSSIFDPFSLDIWDPFEGFGTLANFPSSARETTTIANTRIDWKETPEAHIFKADLPGIKKEEVKVEVEDGRVLHISGERSREQEEKTKNWRREKLRSSREKEGREEKDRSSRKRRIQSETLWACVVLAFGGGLSVTH